MEKASDFYMFESLASVPQNYTLQLGDIWFDENGRDFMICQLKDELKPKQDSAGRWYINVKTDVKGRGLLSKTGGTVYLDTKNPTDVLKIALSQRGLSICAGPGLTKGLAATKAFNTCMRQGLGDSHCYGKVLAEYGIDLAAHNRHTVGDVLKATVKGLGYLVGGPVGLVKYGADLLNEQKAIDEKQKAKQELGALNKQFTLKEAIKQTTENSNQNLQASGLKLEGNTLYFLIGTVFLIGLFIAHKKKLI